MNALSELFNALLAIAIVSTFYIVSYAPETSSQYLIKKFEQGRFEFASSSQKPSA